MLSLSKHERLGGRARLYAATFALNSGATFFMNSLMLPAATSTP